MQIGQFTIERKNARVIKGMRIDVMVFVCLREMNPQRIFRCASFLLENLIYPLREYEKRDRLKLSDVSNQMPFICYEDVSPG